MLLSLVLNAMVASASLLPVAPPCEEASSLDGTVSVLCAGRRVSVRDALGNERRFLADGTVEVYESGVLKFSLEPLGSAGRRLPESR
jgi:hypothetical protein